jgi:hypothetical protein
MKKWFFGLIALLVAAMVFMGCPDPNGGGGNPDPVYTVKVTPDPVSMVPGESKSFSAVLKKDGEPKLGTFTWSVTAGTATKHEGTTIDNNGYLTLASAQTTGTLTVTASINFDGSPHTGTATVTVLSAEDVESALTAITSATDATVLLAALKDSAAGINPALVVNANSAAYWDARSTIASALSSGTITYKIQSLEYALQEINASIFMQAVNDATTASAVQALFTEAAFKSAGGDGLWTYYSGLSSAGKTAVATAIYNDGTTWDAMADAIHARYFTEQLKSYMDAVLGTNPILAQINAFLEKCAETGAYSLTIVQAQLSTVQSALAAAKTTSGSPIKVYLDAGSSATDEQTSNAVQAVYSVIRSAIDSIFIAPSTTVALTASTWKEAAISISGEVDWYQFTAASGTTYYVEWDDSYNGSGSYDGDIRVSAWKADGTPIFTNVDAGYGESYRKTISGYTGTVYLKVVEYNSSYIGTYAIKYTQG